MHRPTKASIEKALLGGAPVTHQGIGKTVSVALDSPESRRLFAYLLESRVREGKDLPAAFIDGLWDAYEGKDAEPEDPPSVTDSTPSDPREHDVWRIERVSAKNFGGLNLFDGENFVWEVKSESWLLDGENGSGKSSLLGAIAWAFTGIRPRDELAEPAHVHAPVMGAADNKVGTWPPLASYPATAKDLARDAEVEVTVTLSSDSGKEATYQRALRNGKITHTATGDFKVDEIFLSTSIAMPLVLPSLKLKAKSGEGALPQAVSQLTGLEELEAIGALASDLSHKAQEYAGYAKKAGLDGLLFKYNSALESARDELESVGKTLPPFTLAEAAAKDGPLVELGKGVAGTAAELTAALKADLAEGTETTKGDVQRSIIVAIDGAAKAIEAGLEGVAVWKTLTALHADLTAVVVDQVNRAIEAAESRVTRALEFAERQRQDERYQLKAAAAVWHSKHLVGDVAMCPLCEQGLDDLQSLRDELNGLLAVGDDARRSLKDNVLDIREDLTKALPRSVADHVRAQVIEPRQALVDSLRATIGSGGLHGELLVRFCDLVDSALDDAPLPVADMPSTVAFDSDSPELESLAALIHRVRYTLTVAAWFSDNKDEWISWWSDLTTDQEPDKDSGSQPQARVETIRSHLARLNAAMAGAQPYARAASHLREAMRVAKEALAIQEEQGRREKVITALAPLKQLPALSQAVARQAIEDLSQRIKDILADMHTSERFKFQSATLAKREGLTVRGSFDSELRIDSSLVANTSWLRSALWAFIFALRAEASEQVGADPLPVWLFDDPQATFDLGHRQNWASYVAALQKTTPAAQILIATHDETFAAKLRVSELSANEAIIKPASSDSGPLEVLEGSRVERKWAEADADRASKEKAVSYLSDARIYLEGMLKAMLAGQGHQLKDMSTSELRNCIERLGNEGRAPWDKTIFRNLAKALENQKLQFLHQSHHADRHLLGFSEAKQISILWPNLSKLLMEGYREIRDYRLLHGMPSVFHLSPPEVDLPEGFAPVVKEHRLRVLGRASAFSGRISEGTLNYEEYDTASSRGTCFGQHEAFRLRARTMEPVARPGDILIVHKEKVPEPRSLVVAAVKDTLLARRYVISEASSNVAVLTANALDPHEIAPPVVARKESVKLRQVVGVLFDHSTLSVAGPHEVAGCDNESSVRGILGRCVGLVEVAGRSAQPLALDGQYLLIGTQVTSGADLAPLDGRPVIALDSDDAWYLKRLRLAGKGLIILESLDGGGEYPPEVLWAPDSGNRSLEQVWEVLGVMFELP
jgi:SOS-response transcriptional repressor LexA